MSTAHLQLSHRVGGTPRCAEPTLREGRNRPCYLTVLYFATIADPAPQIALWSVFAAQEREQHITRSRGEVSNPKTIGYQVLLGGACGD